MAAEWKICRTIFTCTQLPILWRSSFGWCTFSSTGKQPRSHCSPTVIKALQTPGCWKFSSCNLRMQWIIKPRKKSPNQTNQEEFCRQLPCASHIAGCNSETERKLKSHLNTRRKPLLRCSRDAHLCRCAVSSAPPLGFYSRLTAIPGKIALSY